MKALHHFFALAAIFLVAGCNAEPADTPQQEEVSSHDGESESSEDQQVAEVADTGESDSAASNQQAQSSQEPADDSPGISVGQKAPDFELKDQNGQSRSLSEMLKSGQVALVYYRSADW